MLPPTRRGPLHVDGRAQGGRLSARSHGRPGADIARPAGGVAQGLRYSWRVKGERWAGISLYLPGAYGLFTRPLLAYRDEIKVGRGFWAGGEVASDSSVFGKVRVDAGRLNVFAYGRVLAAGTERSAAP